MPVLSPPRVILFDLDDTIVHFTSGQPDFWQLALERELPEHSDLAALVAAIYAVASEYWSDAERASARRQDLRGARRTVVRKALPALGVDPAQCDRIADVMTDEKEAHVRPFDGAIQALTALRDHGHLLALVTNGSSEFQRRKIERFALEPLFALILIEGELGFGKPDERIFRAALDHFDCAPDQAWMVGDNLEADIAGAQRQGIYGVWHDANETGLPPEAVVRPDRIIRRIAELIP